MEVEPKRFGDIEISNSILFVCDMQEKFRPAIQYFEQIAEIANRLTSASKILEIPLIVTEQYPKGLGKTVPEVNIENARLVSEKTKFSMALPEVMHELKCLHKGQTQHIILCGIETHVCVQQTVIDLLKKGFEVHVVADATSSRSQTDRLIALDRFRQMGAYVTTCEAILLQLVGDKDHPHFREIQGVIKTLPPDTKLVNKL